MMRRDGPHTQTHTDMRMTCAWSACSLKRFSEASKGWDGPGGFLEEVGHEDASDHFPRALH